MKISGVDLNQPKSLLRHFALRSLRFLHFDDFRIREHVDLCHELALHIRPIEKAQPRRSSLHLVLIDIDDFYELRLPAASLFAVDCNDHSPQFTDFRQRSEELSNHATPKSSA